MRAGYQKYVFSSLDPGRGFIMAHAYGIAITHAMIEAWSRANSLNIIQMDRGEFDRAVQRGTVDWGWGK